MALAWKRRILGRDLIKRSWRSFGAKRDLIRKEKMKPFLFMAKNLNEKEEPATKLRPEASHHSCQMKRNTCTARDIQFEITR